MPRNTEIKARIPSIAALIPDIELLATGGPDIFEQDDTFFHCTHGRLKLRVFTAGKGELIQYQRPDTAGPKESTYVIVPTSDPDSLRTALTRAYGVAGRVRKRRTLYMIGRTRVHLDEVEGLGNFLELEVVLDEHESAQQGEAVARDLLARLGIAPHDLIDGAYIDLLHR
ncbi:MAG: class IV adenylate cyclase [Bacteroidetes bacterium]|nr:class IV adenylate cyclase [Bacteroidota bacterium]